MPLIEIPFPTFSAVVPDDASGPEFPAGTALVFDQRATPKDGKPVMLRNASGALSIRRFDGDTPAGCSVVAAAVWVGC